jgi:hypothetical protein
MGIGVWIAIVIIIILISTSYLGRSLSLRRENNALCFSKRAQCCMNKYIEECEMASTQMHQLAIALRRSLAKVSHVPIECIYANDTIDVDFANLPSFYDGFPWYDIFLDLQDEFGVGFTGSDVMNVETWLASEIKLGRSVTVKELIYHLYDMINRKTSIKQNKCNSTDSVSN